MKKIGKKIGQILMIAAFILIGAVAGFMMGETASRVSEQGASDAAAILTMVLLFAVMYLAVFLQIVLHEGGHLLFGALTGYRFVSFRVGSVMWIKQGGRLRLRKLSIAGTGGQCLMSPPDMKGGKLPVVLYNMGGAIVNLVTAAIAAACAVVFGEYYVLSACLYIFAAAGAFFALTNGIPMRVGEMDNDGRNTVNLRKSPAARRSFWIQMKGNAMIAQGVRTKDMPKEWFVLPSDEEMQNSITAAMAVLVCARELDEHDFSVAAQTMEKLVNGKNALVGLHKFSLKSDLIYCELIGQNRREYIEKLMNKQYKKLEKSMHTLPSVVRTQYVRALIMENDPAAAEKAKAAFEKLAKGYPYPTEIEAERELISIAEKKAMEMGALN